MRLFNIATSDGRTLLSVWMGDRELADCWLRYFQTKYPSPNLSLGIIERDSTQVLNGYGATVMTATIKSPTCYVFAYEFDGVPVLHQIDLNTKRHRLTIGDVSPLGEWFEYAQIAVVKCNHGTYAATTPHYRGVLPACFQIHAPSGPCSVMAY